VKRAKKRDINRTPKVITSIVASIFILSGCIKTETWAEVIVMYVCALYLIIFFVVNMDYFQRREDKKMCLECLRTPCDVRCPNASEPKALRSCTICGEEIYEGDKYFESDEGPMCEECMEEKSYEEILSIFGESMKTA